MSPIKFFCRGGFWGHIQEGSELPLAVFWNTLCGAGDCTGLAILAPVLLLLPPFRGTYEDTLGNAWGFSWLVERVITGSAHSVSGAGDRIWSFLHSTITIYLQPPLNLVLLCHSYGKVKISLIFCCFFPLSPFFVWFLGHTQWYSGVIPSFILRNYSWSSSGDHIGCLGSNSSWPYARQVSYLLVPLLWLSTLFLK